MYIYIYLNEHPTCVTCMPFVGEEQGGTAWVHARTNAMRSHSVVVASVLRMACDWLSVCRLTWTLWMRRHGRARAHR